MTFIIEKFYGLDNPYDAVEHMLTFIGAARDLEIPTEKILEQVEFHMKKVVETRKEKI